MAFMCFNTVTSTTKCLNAVLNKWELESVCLAPKGRFG